MSMGPALRKIVDEGVPPKTQILTRVKDFNIQSFKSEDGQEQAVPCDTLVAFDASDIKEVEGDVWEFRTLAETEKGMVQSLVYLHGSDILLVRVYSQLG